MPPTVFATPRNDCSTLVGSSGYTAGSGVLGVATSGGAFFPVLGGSSYCRVTVIQKAVAYAPNAPATTYTIFKVTAISGDTLTIAGTLEGTLDRNYAAGDVVEIRVTGGSLSDIQGAVNTLETTVALIDPLAPLAQATIPITANTTMTAANFGRVHICSGTAANLQVTLPPVAGNSGKFLRLQMAPGLTKLVTVVQNAADLIDGATARIMWANEVATLFCDGTNWTKVAGKTISMICQMYPATNQSIPNNVMTTILLDSSAQDNTGLMADTTNRQIKIVRPGTYSLTSHGTFQGVTAACGYTQLRISRNGTDENIATTLPFAVNATQTTIASYVKSGCLFGDLIQIKMIQPSGAAQPIFGGVSNTDLLVYELPTW